MNSRADDLRIAERAAQWHARLDGASPEECAQFMAWLEESPRHVREFLLMQALEVEARGMDREGRMDVRKLAMQDSWNVVSLDAPLTLALPPLRGARGQNQKKGQKGRASDIPEQNGSGKIRWSLAAAAMLAAIALAGSWWLLGGQTYSTAIGEQRLLQLADGSRVELGPRSRLKVRLAADKRELSLLEGEALFRVAADTRRPLRVLAGDTAIQVIGTAFTVNRRPLATTVTVLEGRVRVQQTELAGGEAARIEAGGRLIRQNLEDAALDSWRQRTRQEQRLIFRDDALADIAAEFNRHNASPQIVVTGAARNKRYGGIFDAHDPASLAQFVARDADVSLQRTPERIVIAPAAP